MMCSEISEHVMTTGDVGRRASVLVHDFPQVQIAYRNPRIDSGCIVRMLYGLLFQCQEDKFFLLKVVH